MYFATYNAIYTIKDNGDGQPTQIYEGTEHQCLGGRGSHRALVSLPESQCVATALSDGTLLLLSNDVEKRIPTGIEEPIASLLVICEEPLTILIGTDQGAFVYRLVGEEGPAERIKSFDDLTCREEWYTPWGGPPSIWSFAKTKDGICYADIHVGSIMRSSDEGNTWEPVTPELHKDVHHVTTCPADDNNVYANTANGVYVSTDRGNSWEHRLDGLPKRYGVAIAVHPDDPDLLIVAVQNGPGGGEANLCRSEDGGRTWGTLNEHFGGSINRIIPGSLKYSSDGSVWGVVGNKLYIGKDRATDWNAVWTAPEHDREYQPPSNDYSLDYLLENPIQTLAV